MYPYLSFGCALWNDVAYFQEQSSPVYICTIDAKKCFDSVWHDGLLYKLQSVLPVNHWLLIYKWYKALKAVVRCNGQFSEPFVVTKGTRQGSILSPHLFSIFINELLKELKKRNSGLCIGDVKLQSFAYADDVSLFSSTVKGLQNLVDACCYYSKKWRFNFGIKKAKCMTVGVNKFKNEPARNAGGTFL